MVYANLENVNYKYLINDSFYLSDITVSMEKGKVYGLVGANGSGRTTLCSLLMGFIPHFYKGELNGNVTVFGEDIQDLSIADISLRTGYISQNPFNQISGITDNVFEEIAYGLTNRGYERDEINKRVKEVMDLLNLKSLEMKDPFSLSGGQQQRIAFASMLVLDSDVMIIDEPVAQLDPKSSEEIYKLIKKLKNQGKTIILVESKMELLFQVADELIVMKGGKILRKGVLEDVINSKELFECGINLPEYIKLLVSLKDKYNNIKWLQGTKIPKDMNSTVEIIKKIRRELEDGLNH